MEYATMTRMHRAPDFAEGACALLIDKTGDPHWSPATAAGFTPDMVDAYFVPLPPAEAGTPLSKER